MLVLLSTKFDSSRPFWSELVSVFLGIIMITMQLINCSHDGIELSNKFVSHTKIHGKGRSMCLEKNQGYM